MTIEFCCKEKCPVVEYEENSDIVILGDPKGPEGVTKWTKEQFADFLFAAKLGKFDDVVTMK